MQRWILVAAIALATSGQACTQPSAGHDTPDITYLAPPAYHLPAPIAFAPSWYIPRPAGLRDPRAEYVPPPARIEVSPGFVEVPPARPRRCGQYRYWNGEYCADAQYQRPYLGLKW
jgi:hypothetical protein